MKKVDFLEEHKTYLITYKYVRFIPNVLRYLSRDKQCTHFIISVKNYIPGHREWLECICNKTLMFISQYPYSNEREQFLLSEEDLSTIDILK